jgi:steroid delta-isomerase-like uncharacterized protein
MADNAKIARGVEEELFSKGKLDFVDQHFDPAFKGHETLMGKYGRDQIKKHVQMYRTAFPDLSVTIDDVVAAGDKVLVRWTCKATHRGVFLGKPATGKNVMIDGLSVYNFRNGKIVEEWTHWGALRLLQDLGIAPTIPQPGAPSMP